MAVTWFRRLAAGFSQRKIGFSTCSVYVGFVVGRVSPERWFYKDFGVSLTLSLHRRSVHIADAI